MGSTRSTGQNEPVHRDRKGKGPGPEKAGYDLP